MSAAEFWGSVIGSIIIGLLIKIGYVVFDAYINIWLALLFGFIVVFGGVLIITGVDW